jgi:hypothetical protein
MDRHARQARLAEVGAAGQARIGRAVVDVRLDGFAADVAARYLAGAGVAAVRVRDSALGAGARALDARVRIDVDASLAVAADSDGGASDLRDPAAREFARGAREALRALRVALHGPS